MKEALKEELIDAAQIDLRGLPSKEFVAAKKFRVWISRPAHEAVWQHALQSLKGGEDGGEIVEVGGILVGKVYKDKEGPFLEVIAAIAGEHTRNQGTQVTFTPETWTHVNHVKDKSYPDASIVGWYHTHPRFGIFLSDMDKFIHKHHFPQPWTTAFVVDPVQKSEGFFVWSEGEPSIAPEYWVGQERRTAASIIPHRMKDMETPPEEPDAGKDPAAPVSRAAFALTLVVSFLAMLVLSGYFFMREISHSGKEKILLLALGDQRVELQNTARAVEDLRSKLGASREQNDEANKHIQEQLDQVEIRLRNVAVQNVILQSAVATQQGILDRWQVTIPQEQLNLSPAQQNKPSLPEQPTGKPATTETSAPQTSGKAASLPPKKAAPPQTKADPGKKPAPEKQEKSTPGPTKTTAPDQRKVEEKKP